MGTRTTYTAAVRVPVYASWRCPECKTVLFSEGTISCSRSARTSSVFQSTHNKTEARALNEAREEWTGEVLHEIEETNRRHKAPRIVLNHSKCSKCGTVPIWCGRKTTTFESVIEIIGYLFIPVVVVSGGFAVLAKTSIAAWIVFAVSVCFIACATIPERKYKKKLEKLPRAYMPVIGSLNEELVAYASKTGRTVPTPAECIAAVQSFQP